MHSLPNKSQTDIKKPNFFIVGAPKCGTTALSEYLRCHPAVFLSTPKEPSYFCSDLPGLQYVSNMRDYEQLFSRVTAEHLAIGEASPGYLFSSCAIHEIFKYNHNSRIIVMLRNPAEMLPSYHSQLVFSGFEDQIDFRHAWNLQDDRSQGRYIPKTCRESKLLQYAKIPCFGDQLELLYNTFPQNQILLLNFDDFVNDTKFAYENTLRFLNLTSEGRTNFPVINPNKDIKYGFLNNLLHTPPSWAIKIMNNISGSSIHDTLVKLHGAIKHSNTTLSKRQALDIEFHNELVDIFRPQVEKAEAITNLDLSSWKTYKTD